MSDNSAIEWTDATWNPVTGCTKVSPGCHRCYADTFSERWRGIAGHYFENGFDIQLRPDKLTVPLTWKKPRRVFVNSMSDLFHADIPDEYIAKVFAVMALTPQHTYQLLTKRHGRMRSLLNDGAFRLLCEDEWSTLIADEATPLPRYERERKLTQEWSDFSAKPLPNVWLGVSVEDQKRADLRIPALLDTPAAVRFLSCEPLLGPLDLTKYLGEASGSDEPRGRCVLGGRDGRADDRRAGTSLENGGPQRQSADSLRPATRGTQLRPVLAGAGDEERRPVSRAGASSGLAALPGADPGRADREPQERREVGQPTGEPGTGYSLRAADSRTTGSQAGTAGSVRHQKLHGEADTGAGRADQGEASDGRVPEIDSRGLPGRHAAHLSGSQGRPTIAWLIVGGESGRGARPMDPSWATQIVRQCQHSDVPVFVKQLGSRWSKQHKDIDQFPAELRVRQFPETAAPALS